MIDYTAKAKKSFLTAFIEATSTFRRLGHVVKMLLSDVTTVLKYGDMGKCDNGPRLFSFTRSHCSTTSISIGRSSTPQTARIGHRTRILA